jgi:lipopolysaccharide export LptBFGC system permease protein LptF
MMSEKLISAVSKMFLVGAFVLLAIAVFERIVNFFGYTILLQAYTAGRVTEFAAVLLMFVIALTLREMRDALKK